MDWPYSRIKVREAKEAIESARFDLDRALRELVDSASNLQIDRANEDLNKAVSKIASAFPRLAKAMTYEASKKGENDE